MRLGVTQGKRETRELKRLYRRQRGGFDGRQEEDLRQEAARRARRDNLEMKMRESETQVVVWGCGLWTRRRGRHSLCPIATCIVFSVCAQGRVSTGEAAASRSVSLRHAAGKQSKDVAQKNKIERPGRCRPIWAAWLAFEDGGAAQSLFEANP